MVLSKNLCSVAVVSSCLLIGLAVADEPKFPTELQVLVEEASEAFYDGNYADAMRLSEEARRWARSEKNKKLMEDHRIDWQIVDGRVVGLQAEILFAQGQSIAAASKVQSAQRILDSRRAYWSRRGDQIGQLWLYLLDSYLTFVAGDVCRPCPDYQQSGRLADSVRQFVQDRGQGDKAVRLYSAAISKLDKIGLYRVQDQDVTTGFPLFCNQLKLRAFVSLAKAEIFRSGCPDEARLNDARAFLVRAEELHSHNLWWKVAVGPDAMIQNIAYHDLQKVADEKAAAIGKQNGDVTESDIIELKRYFWQAINDWLTIMFVRAEVEAYAELQGLSVSSTTGIWERNATERCYTRAVLLLSSHFRPGHPMLTTALRSKAVWLTIASDVDFLGRGQGGSQSLRLVAMSRDAIFITHKLRAQLAGALTPNERIELACLEMRALHNVLKIHEKLSILNDSQISEAKSRIETLSNEIAEVAQSAKTDRVEADVESRASETD